MAYHEKAPIPIVEGGTGAQTLTQNGILFGNATSAIGATAAGTTGQCLMGTTSANPSFTGSPSFSGTVTAGTGVIVTSGGLTLASGSALSAFVDWTSWTPTLTGRTTAGTTTYSFQNGYYCRIGNMVTIQFSVQYTAATGTGDLLLGGLPITIHGLDMSEGSVIINTQTWPAGRTNIVVCGQVYLTTAIFICSGSAVDRENLQMANVTTYIQGQLTYRVGA